MLWEPIHGSVFDELHGCGEILAGKRCGKGIDDVYFQEVNDHDNDDEQEVGDVVWNDFFIAQNRFVPSALWYDKYWSGDKQNEIKRC